MKKDGPLASFPGGSMGKIFGGCFETKPLVLTFVALTFVFLVWNLPPYYQNLLSTTRPCSASVLTTTTTTTTTTAFSMATNTTTLPNVTNPVPYTTLPNVTNPVPYTTLPNVTNPVPYTTLPNVTNPVPYTTLPNFTNPVPYTALPNVANPVPSQKISTPRTIPILDPNKRVFQAYGNAAALFVQMGAYRGGPNTFAVVGLASKPIHVFGKPWFKCEWISNNGSSTRALGSKILPDWGYGRVYTVVVVNCTFPVNPNKDNSGGKLTIKAYYGKSLRKFEKFVALEEAPGSYNESKYRPPYQYDYLYCGSSLYGDLSATRIREWMAYHAWFFGPKSHFVFHDAGGISSEVKAVLEPWVRLGRATIQDIRAQAEYDGYYYNQFLIVNDCLHRYRFSANWTFYFDVDEYIYLPNGNSLESVLNEFSAYTQFTILQNPISSVLCLNKTSQEHSRQWGFEKLVFKDSRTRIRRDRKYAIQAKNAYATGVHMSENVIGKTLHRTESKIRYYHYHNSINVMGEPCREMLPESAKRTTTWYQKLPYVYDDNMKNLANTIKDFERKTIGAGHS